MDLRNCVRCGQVFASDGDKVCPQCQEEEEQDFEKVKEYIYEHGQATITKISEETGVEEKLIQKFIRKGRLMELNVDLTVKCRKCGTKIKSGDYCEDCREEMVGKFTGAKDKSKEESKPKEKKTGRMHYKRRND